MASPGHKATLPARLGPGIRPFRGILRPYETLRARATISSQNMGAEAPVWQGARRAHTVAYVTDEQRSHTGWIGAQKWEVIVARALKPARPYVDPVGAGLP